MALVQRTEQPAILLWPNMGLMLWGSAYIFRRWRGEGHPTYLDIFPIPSFLAKSMFSNHANLIYALTPNLSWTFLLATKSYIISYSSSITAETTNLPCVLWRRAMLSNGSPCCSFQQPLFLRLYGFVLGLFYASLSYILGRFRHMFFYILRFYGIFFLFCHLDLESVLHALQALFRHILRYLFGVLMSLFKHYL